MKRTQIYLTKNQYRTLKKKAYKEDDSLAGTIRRLIKLGLRQEVVAGKREQPQQKEKKHFLEELTQLAEKEKFKGPKDLSTRLDDYLYGQK